MLDELCASPNKGHIVSDDVMALQKKSKHLVLLKKVLGIRVSVYFVNSGAISLCVDCASCNFVETINISDSLLTDNYLFVLNIFYLYFIDLILFLI